MPPSPPTPRERKAFPLRIDPQLFAALRAWADDELRSVNGQIEFLLARAAREAGRWPRPRRRPVEPAEEASPLAEE